MPRRRLWAAAALALVLALVLGAVAASWHNASRVLVPDHSPWSEGVEIVALSRDEIVLEREEATLRPGYYGLVWHAGHAVVGPVVETDEPRSASHDATERGGSSWSATRWAVPWSRS